MGREQRGKIQVGKVVPIQGPLNPAANSCPPGIVEQKPLANSSTSEYRIVISTGMNTQEEIRALNDMAKKGFEHYLTVPLYGSTEKMYFRKQ